MADNVLDQIIEKLRSSGSAYFPQHSELQTVRVVGHTPKPDQCTYEIVLDFERDSERVSAKIYRGAKSISRVQLLAKSELDNLNFAYQACSKRKLGGVPRPIGDFTELGAVLSTKINGLPLQSILMKVALLPQSGNQGLLRKAATQAGEWLQQFHKATSAPPTLLDTPAILTEMETLCLKAQKEGLPAQSTQAILDNARSQLSLHKRPMRSSAVLQEFIPLNVLVSEDSIGFADFAAMRQPGNSLLDAAIFLAAVEALEKYPFCERSITTPVQAAFLEGYGVNGQDQPLLTVLKMKVLLQMFAQGRTGKETAVRKKVMWANVMKRFIQQAAERSMAPAA